MLEPINPLRPVQYPTINLNLNLNVHEEGVRISFYCACCTTRLDAAVGYLFHPKVGRSCTQEYIWFQLAANQGINSEEKATLKFVAFEEK